VVVTGGEEALADVAGAALALVRGLVHLLVGAREHLLEKLDVAVGRLHRNVEVLHAAHVAHAGEIDACALARSAAARAAAAPLAAIAHPSCRPPCTPPSSPPS